MLQVVGEGNVFTKEQVRSAFPGVSQADRRIRDLRDFGWVIKSSAEDASLSPNEQRFVRRGVPVWNRSARRAARAKAITSKERYAILARDGFQCVVCGVGGGEPYPDSPTERAVLGVFRQDAGDGGSEAGGALVTKCKRCKSGGGASPPAVGLFRLINDVELLDEPEKVVLRRWVKRGWRGPTPLDRVWSAYRHLPDEGKTEFERRLMADE